MLDIDFIRTNTEILKKSLERRGMDSGLADEFLTSDKQWRNLTTKIQELKQKQKQHGAQKEIKEAKEIKEQIQELKQQLEDIEKKRHQALVLLPNIPFEDVPDGEGEEGNKELHTSGTPPKFSFSPKDHIELGELLDVIDTKKAADVSGSRFFYLKNEGAMFEFALIQYTINLLTKEGFTPIIPPVMIRPEVYAAMGRLSGDQKDERYHLEKDDMYLVGSAEHTLGPLLMNETLKPQDLPKRYIGFSSCFRREAGSYGKDTRGIIRVHQFDKLEMYTFTTPDKSEEEHKYLLSLQEKLYKGLDIPYRVVEMCAGDMGPADARQYDIEAWIPSQKQYREIASCSNTTDYQTRGIKTKIRDNNTNTYAHALNATAIAIPRMVVALLENNQKKDGSVTIPRVLRKYMSTRQIRPV